MIVMKKYYVVKKGRNEGIYTDWETCKAQVDGYAGAIYKSFKNINEATAYFSGETELPKQTINTPNLQTTPTSDYVTPYAFVDGSYNAATNTYGYGGFLQIDATTRKTLQGKGTDSEKAGMRNVAGEIDGALAAVKEAVANGLTHLTILYDYQGIENWVTGAWKAKNRFTQTYKCEMNALMTMITIEFVKVKGHSGVPGNELADQLAKESVGL